jgi:hypothetical protein
MEMVEVFKTNVKDPGLANLLINHIHNTFPDYTANFDLEDCDKILRVACTSGTVQPYFLINILNDFGFQAEVLPDDFSPVAFNGNSESLEW